jgi:hypothetical protein
LVVCITNTFGFDLRQGQAPAEGLIIESGMPHAEASPLISAAGQGLSERCLKVSPAGASLTRSRNKRLRPNSAAFVAIVLEQIPDYNFEKSDLAKRLH